MDVILNIEYFLFYKKLYYENKIIKNYYFSRFLIIYKYYDSRHTILKEKIIVYKHDINIIYVIKKYDIDGLVITTNG